MSEFSDHTKRRSTELTNYMIGLIAGEDCTQLIEKYHILTENYVPSDVLAVFDCLYDAGIETEKIKTASNKLFNILFKTFNNYPAAILKKYGYLYYLKEDNTRISLFLKEIGNNIKILNTQTPDDVIPSLVSQFEHLAKIDKHYSSKENVLFPQIEKRWENSACLKLMWSFHNDIRTNIKLCIDLLKQTEFDLQNFNRISAKVFFNIKTIIFREEKVLFPILTDTFEEDELDELLRNNAEIGFSFIELKDIRIPEKKRTAKSISSILNLSTGELSLKQMELIFRHLPVDITFVDRNDEVRFYSDPPHRIFTRTKSIIGRTVRNCHPRESVDVVMKIIDAFKEGKKDSASFWIDMKNKKILIRYFAIRNEQNEYEGTLEVSQEISEIQSLEGEKRLLDWDELEQNDNNGK